MILRLLFIAGLFATAVAAQNPASSTALIRGSVLSQADSSFLPGAEIRLFEGEPERLAAETLSDETGTFSFQDLPPGVYRLRAAFPGFVDYQSQALTLSSGQQLEVTIQLSLAELREEVEVVGKSEEAVPTSGASTENLSGELVDIAPVRGDTFQALLPLVPGVIRATDGRIVMKGGTATQSSLVVNSSNNVSDPATGNFGFNLPTDAIESVDIQPNPYSAEFGRFASGVTNILTRQGTPQWKFVFNNFLPKPKIRDGSILGIGAFTPRLGARGPLIKDRLFVSQTLQYRYVQTKVPGQPDLQNDTRLESFDSFTQFNANLNDRHAVTGVLAFFPRKLDFVNLDTFNPLEVTPNFHQRGWNVGLSERFTISGTALLDSTLSLKNYDVDIYGQGLADMNIRPDGNSGNFFNLQRRRTQSIQWAENLSFFKPSWGGDHLFKIGVDVLHSVYDGESSSSPVNIIRPDGTLSRLITFSGPTSQRVRSTDLALYGQDRWRVNDLLLLELGARLDRDGALGRTNLSPRAGFVLNVWGNEKGFLRGGAGVFYDRTPLNVTAFESFERRNVQDFSAGGVEQGASRTFQLVSADDLRTPYSFTWNLEYDHWATRKLLLKTNFLRRSGFHEFLIDPVSTPAPALQLDTRGRSRYWEVELTARYTVDEESYFIASYVRSRARQDLNDYDEFFGNFRNPIIRPNEFSLADTDTPNRFIFRGTTILPGKWIVSPVVEIRDGFPFSLIDEDQDFVGARNRGGRFPRLVTLDLDIQRWVKIWKWKTRVGIRLFNVFNTFNPRDVQNNIDSTRFGVFSNTIERIIGGTLQIEP